MRRYESVWVVNGDLPDEEVKAGHRQVQPDHLRHRRHPGGVEEWGRKKLSYKVRGTARGYYVLVDYAGTPATVKELERNYRIDDRIIRFLTSKKSDKVNLEALQAEIAAKAKATAAATAAAAAAAAAVEAAAPVAEEAVALEVAAPAAAAAPQGREE